MSKTQSTTDQTKIPNIKNNTPQINREWITWNGLTGTALVSLAFYCTVHIIALLGLFYNTWSWNAWKLCIGSYYLRMFGITAGFHRYFSHRSFKTSRAFQFVLAWIGSMSFQKGVLWWASHHRHHHKNADGEDDIHSPTRDGFLWSHCGWFLLSNKYNETDWRYIPDLKIYPELLWINEYHWVPGVLGALILYCIGGWEYFYWGSLLSTVFLWHGTYTINSLCHIYGSVRYRTTDTSKNSLILALITMGEGWHNNHHTYMSSANQGFFWWEIDMSYTILKILEIFGIVADLRKPPLDELEKKRISLQEPLKAN